MQDRESTGKETEASDSSVTRCVCYAKASKMRKHREATGKETEASDFSVTRCVATQKFLKCASTEKPQGKKQRGKRLPCNEMRWLQARATDNLGAKEKQNRLNQVHQLPIV